MSAPEANKSLVFFTPLEIAHFDKLISYFNQLGPESKSRFGPHPFTRESISELAGNPEKYSMYVAVNSIDNSIVAYSIIQFGWLEFDTPRLLTYGLTPSKRDCTFAPSVSDNWQSRGIGSDFFHFILADLKTTYEIKRMILWGGVKSSNIKALGFYNKHGFTTLGEFEQNGSNFDMILDL